jgi:predicted Ser/Thr protein kinase
MQPEQLGRYRIIKEIGRGAMGLVYLAHDPEIDRDVAIKTVQIFASLPERERGEARERMLREARAAGKLLHPGIVTLFDAGEADGALYLAMEYVEGKTLDHYCRSDSLLQVGEAAEMVARIAESLDYAHGAGIIHRDVKPTNLMHVGGHAVKIMDFGLAKPSEGELTTNGELLGTPSYMSPEQIRGKNLDGRSDLFSLGVVLFELLTGERPFPGETISSIIYRIVNEEPRDIADFKERIEPALSGFLQRALAKDPGDRFSSGALFAAELREAAGLPGSRVAVEAPSAAVSVAGQQGEAAIPESDLPAPERTRPRRSSTGPFILGTVLLIVLLGAGAYIFRDRLGLFQPQQMPDPWLEASVRAEPAEAVVSLNGAPLEPGAGGAVRYQAAGEPDLLVAVLGCRRLERELSPADAGSEVVLVLDSAKLDYPLELAEVSADVRLNGERLAATPLDVELDLCLDNRLELEAEGYFPAVLEIPSGATPLDARKLLAAIELQPIPTGILVLSETSTEVVFYVDGRRLDRGVREVELPEGRHTIRLKNEAYWIDVTIPVDIVGGESLAPELGLPPLTTLVVQAFPANCKVFLRKPGGAWKYIDDTPARKKVAVGKYEVRVTLNPTGESRDRAIKLGPGENAPVRVAFGRNQ